MQLPFVSRKTSLLVGAKIDWLRGLATREWADLRGISNSYAAKSTILIPLIGYWIIFNDYVVNWLRLAHQLEGIPATDHISPRVLWLYMGFCAIALGTLIYALRCPLEVKKYGDYVDYINGDGPVLKALDTQAIVEELEKAGYDATFAKDDDLLYMHFDYLNNLYPRSRLFVTVCFVFGFAVLSILSAQVFVRVLGLMTAVY